MFLHTFNYCIATLHHAHINNLEVVAAKYNSNDVFANVMDITFDGCQDNRSVVLNILRIRLVKLFLSFHKGCEVSYRSFHDSCRLNHLR